MTGPLDVLWERYRDQMLADLLPVPEIELRRAFIAGATAVYAALHGGASLPEDVARRLLAELATRNPGA